MTALQTMVSFIAIAILFAIVYASQIAINLAVVFAR